MNVTSRTSEMFTALIRYNCTLDNAPYVVPHDNNTSDNCSVTMPPSNTEKFDVIVTCSDILNYAGRDWHFGLIGNSTSQTVLNASFTITFEPLPLNETDIKITPHENFTATIVIPDCEKIADLKYLQLLCDTSKPMNSSISSNCMVTCSNLIPGSDNVASLIRLPIPIADQESEHRTFPGDSKNETYRIGGYHCVNKIIIQSNLLFFVLF